MASIITQLEDENNSTKKKVDQMENFNYRANRDRNILKKEVIKRDKLLNDFNYQSDAGTSPIKQSNNNNNNNN